VNPVPETSRYERTAAVSLALARTAVCAYRAATQSIVHDEAFSFNLFLSHSWHDAYFQYNAANHVLFSLLAKLSMALFGASEWVIRLPIVLAGFFLMLGVWRLLEFSESRAARWIAFVAIGLHPLILDFSVAARGYGLAMAFLAWTLYELRAHEARLGSDALAGVLLGLSCAASFTAGFPAAGLLAAVFLITPHRAGSALQMTRNSMCFRRARLRCAGVFLISRGWDRLRRPIRIALPAAAAFGAVCGGALLSVRLSDFFAGTPALHDSMINLAYGSIHATQRMGVFGTYKDAEYLAFALVPAVAVFLAAHTVREWRLGERRQILVPIALGFAAGGMIAAHYFFGLLYPIDRTGLAMMLLFALAWALAAGNASNPWLRRANLLAGALLAIQFATQFHTSYFQIWWYDRSTKEIAQRIAADSRGKPPDSVSIGATWIHQPALEYYRVVNHLKALEPVVRTPDTPVTGQDYYVLNVQDKRYSATRGRTVMFSDPFAGVVLVK
jgi:4-amino-4-deoxy-L-arabinose transferase-like glycosyltransferase